MTRFELVIAGGGERIALLTREGALPYHRPPLSKRYLRGESKPDDTLVLINAPKDYAKLVAAKDGWANAPPGTRTSLYQNPEYLKVAPFAKPTLASIDAADPNKPTVQPVPYVGVQYAAIPEFQGIGTAVGQQFSAALSGASTVDAALAAAQSSTEREMKRAGYIK